VLLWHWLESDGDGQCLCLDEADSSSWRRRAARRLHPSKVHGVGAQPWSILALWHGDSARRWCQEPEQHVRALGSKTALNDNPGALPPPSFPSVASAPPWRDTRSGMALIARNRSPATVAMLSHLSCSSDPSPEMSSSEAPPTKLVVSVSSFCSVRKQPTKLVA
jgi:hypothetical protein